MRYALLGLTLLATAADRTSDRDALIAADRSLSDRTAAAGLTRGFFPALTDDAIYLYPGAPLLRGGQRGLVRGRRTADRRTGGNRRGVRRLSRRRSARVAAGRLIHRTVRRSRVHGGRGQNLQPEPLQQISDDLAPAGGWRLEVRCGWRERATSAG